MPRRIDRVDQVAIRMYRMGTGDCFTIKFMQGRTVTFKLMIDCGCWSGDKDKLKPFIEELKNDVEGSVDALVVTHEHKDHVHGFDACRSSFAKEKFQARRTWMAWTENDGDRNIEKWKRDYGEKKRSLALAAGKLAQAVANPQFAQQLGASRDANDLLERRKTFASVLNGFRELHSRELGAAGEYVDGLAGMTVVKERIAQGQISYFEPGDIIEHLPGLEGVRIFVLGPPTDYAHVRKEKGPKGEAYEHNDKLEDVEAFAAALNGPDQAGSQQLLPFDDYYISKDSENRAAYDDPKMVWRRIDYDWLLSAGSLALRMSSRTNNLSLVLAIEFIESGKVLLFPGDAEFGSWNSWQDIDWEPKVKGLTTEKLLNRVVFYKVAHHLSHNGTARRIGLDMMTSPDLVAMATLDYDIIPPGWKSTMPNVGILKDLLEKSKGRTLVMNTNGLLFDRKEDVPLEKKIQEYRKLMSTEKRKEFDDSVEETEHYISYTLDV